MGMTQSEVMSGCDQNQPPAATGSLTIAVDDVEEQLQVILGLLHQVPRLDPSMHTQTHQRMKTIVSEPLLQLYATALNKPKLFFLAHSRITDGRHDW